MDKKTRLLLLVVCITIFLVGCFKIQKEIQDNNVNQLKEYNLSMIMAGDALIHNGVYLDAADGEGGYDFKPMFKYLKPIVQTYDLAFYNQETIIGGKKIGLSTYPRFNSPEEIGDALVDTGFNMVSLANNHTLDRGEVAIINSVDYWNDKNVITAGSYTSYEQQEKVNIYEKNNITYVFLAYTTITNGLKTPDDKEYLVNIYSDEKVKEEVEKIKNKVDVVIVSMHWGTEYTHTPTSEQKRIANYLSSLGVDIIIGHHPHVIEPIEYINDTLVIYSLGNLISAQEGISKLIGMLVSLNVNKTIDNDKISISITDVKGDLIYTYYDNFKDFEVIPFNQLNNNLLDNYEDLRTEYSSIINQYDKTIKVGIFK